MENNGILKQIPSEAMHASRVAAAAKHFACSRPNGRGGGFRQFSASDREKRLICSGIMKYLIYQAKRTNQHDEAWYEC